MVSGARDIPLGLGSRVRAKNSSAMNSMEKKRTYVCRLPRKAQAHRSSRGKHAPH